MAKLTVTFTVLFFTLALSLASSEPENDNLTTSSAEPDPDHSTGPHSTSSDEVTVPVNFVNFHPINRHFPRRPLTTAPLSRRPCHHRRHELLRRGIQIHYGNDMILTGEEKPTASDPLSDVVVVDIPAITVLVEEGSMKITVKRKEEGEGARENMLRTKIRKFLNHLV